VLVVLLLAELVELLVAVGAVLPAAVDEVLLLPLPEPEPEVLPLPVAAPEVLPLPVAAPPSATVNLVQSSCAPRCASCGPLVSIKIGHRAHLIHSPAL